MCHVLYKRVSSWTLPVSGQQCMLYEPFGGGACRKMGVYLNLYKYRAVSRIADAICEDVDTGRMFMRRRTCQAKYHTRHTQRLLC